MKEGGRGSQVKTTPISSYPPNLVPFRVKTTLNLTDCGRSALYPQAVTSSQGGGGAFSAIVTFFY